MRAFALLPVFGLVACSAPQPAPDAGVTDGGWVELFNGRDLSGWHT